MTGKSWLAMLGVIAVAVGVGYAALKLYRTSQIEECYACQRAIHAHSRTVAVAKGKSRVFCCPACALSEHEQERKPILITELTDFPSGAKLSPDTAFLVKGSDVNMCAHKHELVDADKRPAGVRYDRCAPSLLAFGRRTDAVQFTHQHGGEVLRFGEIVAAFSQ